MDNTLTEIECPTCGKPVVWEPSSPYRPFCCKSCQLIDLGDWAAGEKCIPGKGDINHVDE